MIYVIIVSVSLTLAFSQAKPCCKNKASKGKVSCKLKQANIDINNDEIISDEESKVAENRQNVQNTLTQSSKQNNCNGCKVSPWWKFWSKKKNCCKT